MLQTQTEAAYELCQPQIFNYFTSLESSQHVNSSLHSHSLSHFNDKMSVNLKYIVNKSNGCIFFSGLRLAYPVLCHFASRLQVQVEVNF